MLVPIIGLLYANAQGERDRLIASANDDLLNQARLVASAHDQLLRTVERLLVELAQDPLIQNYESPECNAVAARLADAHPAYSNIAVSNLEGTVVCSGNPFGLGSLVGDRPYYQEAIATEQLSTSGYLFGRISLRPVDVFTMPVFDASGELTGVLELSIDLAWLTRLIEAQGLRENVQTTLLGPDGLVLVRVPSDDVDTGSEVGNQPWVQDAGSSTEPRTLLVEEPGKPEALGAVVPLTRLSGVTPGYVVVTSPRGAALAGAENAFRRGLITVVAVGRIGLGWAWSVTTFGVHRPLRALREAARAYGRGRFTQRVEVGRISSQELRELAEAFNSMAETMSLSRRALRRAARTDHLTGYPNRTEIVRLIDRRIRRTPHSHATLVKLQLRNFSGVNATFGFEGGDSLLRQVPDRLKQTFPRRSLIGRTDGDEFVVFVPRGDDDLTPDIVALVRAAFDESFVLDGEPVHLAARASVARYPRDGGDALSLDRRASLAITRVGGDWLVEYDAAHDEPREGQVKLLGELHDAIGAGQLELYYQPQIHLQTGRVLGAEALMRWHRVDGSLSLPGEFINLAEQSGLIRSMTEWALEEAAGRAVAWRRAGLLHHVSVNLSAIDFGDSSLSDRLEALKERHGIASGGLDLEITESALMTDPSEAARMCRSIRDSGFTIGIDDFGTGYSPLVYLQRLPVTSIKIDQSFVQEVLASQRSRDIVETTIDLARRFGLATIAEGIETAEVAEALREIGCQIGQGYYFAHPMPAADFERWAAERAVASPLSPTRR